MEDSIKKGNQTILDHVLKTDENVGDNKPSIDLCTCRYEYNDDFASMDPDEYAEARKSYESMVAARYNLLTFKVAEDRLKVAEAILHDVTLMMKQMGYDIDYNNIRDDMDMEMRALIAITDIITLYRFVLNKYESMPIEKVQDFIVDEIENSNMEYVDKLEGDSENKYDGAFTGYDDHNVSGLIDN